MRKSRWPSAKNDHDFDRYLRGAPEGSIRLFQRFVSMARAAGRVTFELQRHSVVLCGSRRIFASVAPTEQGIEGILNLPRRLTDRRIYRSEPLTKRIVLHRYLVRCAEDLDSDFAAWLEEGLAIGNGEPIQPSSRLDSSPTG
jgi:Domain of unknown function (DUF5655)